jgi:hypothetical protein
MTTCFGLNCKPTSVPIIHVYTCKERERERGNSQNILLYKREIVNLQSLKVTKVFYSMEYDNIKIY